MTKKKENEFLEQRIKQLEAYIDADEKIRQLKENRRLCKTVVQERILQDEINNAIADKEKLREAIKPRAGR